MADDGREIAADVLDGAAELAAKIASSSGDPVAGLAVGIGAAITKIVAELVRSIGADGAKKAIEELKRRVDAGEGVITAADIEEDDQYVDQYIRDLFAKP